MDFQKVGLLKKDEARACAGYTTVSTFRGNSVKLIDMDGKEVHRWELPGLLGSLAYLLPGGRIVEMSWDGDILWEYTDPTQHHDFRRLPNGNTLVCESVNGRIFEVHHDSMDIVWDYINPDFSSPFPLCRDPANAIFRAYRYTADSDELAGTPLAS